MDILDRAQVVEQQHLSASIADARQCMGQGPGAEFCRECDAPIPMARRRAMPGCRLCIRCQTELEERNAF